MDVRWRFSLAYRIVGHDLSTALPLVRDAILLDSIQGAGVEPALHEL
jgi:hypothetical protein